MSFKFGTAATTTPLGGQPQQPGIGGATPASSGFSFGGGSLGTTAPPMGGGGGGGGTTSLFGTATPTFGLGGTAAGSTTGCLGVVPAPTTSLFGGGSAATQPPTSTSSAFNFTGLGGSTPSANPLGGPMGGSIGGSMGGPLSEYEKLYSSVVGCSLFGDDRDGLLGRWNLLQASWGKGKSYYANNAPPLVITQENPLCRFKAIGYSSIPSHKDEDGFLAFNIRKKIGEMEANKAQFITSLLNVLGNKPGIKFTIDSMISLTPEITQIVGNFTADNNNGVRKISIGEIFPFLNSSTVANGLKGLGIEGVNPKVAFSKQQIQEYLDNPPLGVDHRIWKQAQLDNPDPKSLIPVPMIGFKALQQRIKCQEAQAKNFQGRLDAIAGDISDLRKRHQDTLALMNEAKRKQLELGHRVLHVIVRQEIARKSGFTIQPEEENLRIQLEALQAELSAPTQFKGRLNELLSQIRLQSQTTNISYGGPSNDKYVMDPFLQQDIKNILKQEQDGISALIGMIKDDLKDLGKIQENLMEEKKINKWKY